MNYNLEKSFCEKSNLLLDTKNEEEKKALETNLYLHLIKLKWRESWRVIFRTKVLEFMKHDFPFFAIVLSNSESFEFLFTHPPFS